MIIQFGICGVHIDNGTGYRNSTVIFLAIYNTLSLRSVLRRQQGRFGLIWACMPPQKKETLTKDNSNVHTRLAHTLTLIVSCDSVSKLLGTSISTESHQHFL